MNTTDKSRIDAVRDISAQLTHHEGMVEHLNEVLRTLIDPSPLPEVREVVKTASGKRVRRMHKAKKPSPQKSPKAVFEASPKAVFEASPKSKKPKQQKPPTPAKGSKAVQETKVQIQLLSSKPRSIAQIRTTVHRGYRIVKQALLELEHEHKVKRFPTENKIGGFSDMFVTTPQKSSR